MVLHVGGFLIGENMTPQEARIYDLETQLADALLERDAAYKTVEDDIQTRERYALQVINEIAYTAAQGRTIPTLEKTLLEFSLWVERGRWAKGQMVALATAVDALEDIITGRMDSTKVSAKQLIEESKR